MKFLGQRTVEEILSLLRNIHFFLKFSLIFLLGCGLAATRPKIEMSFAAAAFSAAKKVNAQTLSPTFYRKAEFYYLKAKASYRRKYFNKAKQYAKLSRRFSEEAEFDAIKKTAEE